jgi:hypothetical protein
VSRHRFDPNTSTLQSCTVSFISASYVSLSYYGNVLLLGSVISVAPVSNFLDVIQSLVVEILQLCMMIVTFRMK